LSNLLLQHTQFQLKICTTQPALNGVVVSRPEWQVHKASHCGSKQQ